MALLDIVLPRRCAVCGRVGASLCGMCLQRLVRCAPPWCERCGAPGPWPVRRCAECGGRRLAFASARAALVYDGRCACFVASWKERGRRDLAAVAAELVVAAIPRPEVDVDHIRSRRSRSRLRRGHAPAAALAAELAAAWSIPIAPSCGAGRGSVASATCRGPSAARNVAGAFSPRGLAAAGCASSTTSTRPVDGDGVRDGAAPRRRATGRGRLFCAAQ